MLRPTFSFNHDQGYKILNRKNVGEERHIKKAIIENRGANIRNRYNDESSKYFFVAVALLTLW